ncbi:MAG: L-rhamnose/proton symporter RhaT [Mariniphaga sp.]
MDETNLAIGVSLSLVAGVFLGIFAFPMKTIIKWQWENTWLVFSFWACVFLPVAWAFYTVPNLLGIYSSVPISTIIIVFLFGAGWGVANVGFGIGINTLGIALGTAIVLGLNNALGAILPIIIYTPEELLTSTGIKILIGVSIMLIGIVICAIAGSQKEKALNRNVVAEKKINKFTKGLIICLVAGIFGAMFNFALVAGKPMENVAMVMGASRLNAANPSWCISLLGGFAVTAVYCFAMLKKNKTFSLFKLNGKGSYWILTFGMGLMWFGGVALYGSSVMNLGKLGASIGWPLAQSMAVVSGSLMGIITGEWKGTGRKPLIIMISGLFFLLIGILVISQLI